MKKKFLSLALALLLILSLAACSAAAPRDEAAENPASTAKPNPGLAEYDSADAATEDYAASDKSGVVNSSDPVSSIPLSDKIIYSGSATVETLEYEDTLKKLEDIISEYQGFLQSSSVSGNDYRTYAYGGVSYRSAYYEIRIPSDKFSAVTGLLETLGNVPHLSTNADNVTMQYRDTESRLNARRTEETRLLELMSKAETVEDLLKVESYLSDVRYEIESLESQLKNWDSLVSYSTLQLTINEVRLYSEDEKASISYGEQLSITLSNSMKALGRFFKGLFKGIVAALPVLVILAVIAVPTILIIRHSSRKKAAKAAEKQNDNSKE